jgi:hypothetical protein
MISVTISDALISRCEAWIRAGNIQLAVKALLEINAAQVPRRYRLPLANLCRRTGLVNLGLKLLTPVVRPRGFERRALDRATHEERAEFAVLLQRMGSVQEALQILASIPRATVPEASLYASFCHFNLWQYREAIPHLEEFIASKPLPYMALVAKVNLCAALIDVQDFARAKDLLSEVQANAEGLGARRLRANALEMWAQIHVHEGALSDGLLKLNEASDLLSAPTTFDQLFVLKWKAIVEALRSGSIEPLVKFSAAAREHGESEAVRETDLFQLIIKFDPERFNHLYFGTPFAAYRERILRSVNQTRIEPRYLYGSYSSSWLDLEGGDLHGGGESLPLNSKTLGVFRSLLKDFYRPQPIGAVFAELFPGEHFDIFSSPARVRQAIYRARLWIQENNLPVGIRHRRGRYSVDLSGDFAFQIPVDRLAVSVLDRQIAQLQTAFAALSGFTSVDARRVLAVSRATCTRILKNAVESGRLKKFGASTSTVYYFNEGSQTNAA